MPRDKPFILDETAEDESFLVGTRPQLETFARSILNALNGTAFGGEWHGIPVEQYFGNSSLTDSIADVVLGGFAVVESEKDRRRLVNAIRENGGDPAIDWVSRDTLRATST